MLRFCFVIARSAKRLRRSNLSTSELQEYFVGGVSTMSRAFTLILIPFILLVACTAAPTATPVPTNTPLPTATSTATATTTPTPKATNTPSPTATATREPTPLPAEVPLKFVTPYQAEIDYSSVTAADTLRRASDIFNHNTDTLLGRIGDVRRFVFTFGPGGWEYITGQRKFDNTVVLRNEGIFNWWVMQVTGDGRTVNVSYSTVSGPAVEVPFKTADINGNLATGVFQFMIGDSLDDPKGNKVYINTPNHTRSGGFYSPNILLDPRLFKKGIVFAVVDDSRLQWAFDNKSFAGASGFKIGFFPNE
jgi:hypothetical protein